MHCTAWAGPRRWSGTRVRMGDRIVTFTPYNHAMPDYYAGVNAERRVVARLTVMGEPKAKERPRAQPGGKGRSYTPKATRDAETIIQNAWDALTLPDYPTAGTFRIDVCCYLGTRRHVDGDNLLKLVKDALNG